MNIARKQRYPLGQGFAVHLTGLLLLLVAGQSAAALEPAEIYRRFGPAVVTVVGPEGIGSGFAIQPHGNVVTNHHVVKGQSALVVIFPSGEKRSVARIVAQDAARDLAVLQVIGAPSVRVVLGDSSNVQVGERVVTIGSPQGLSQTVTDGIISQIRSLRGVTLLQTTAPISPGSSGGPLFNQRGEVVGITTFRLRESQNLNFAVGVDELRKLLGEPARARPGILPPDIPRRERAAPEFQPPSGFSIHFWNGYVVSVKWYRDTGSAIEYEQGGGSITIPRSLVARIVHNEDGKVVEVSQISPREAPGTSHQAARGRTSWEAFLEGVRVGRAGAHQEAIRHFDEATRLDPRSAAAYANRAIAYAILGRHSSALRDVSEAIRLEPQFAEAYRLRGEILGTQRDAVGALRDLDEAIRLAPGDPLSKASRAKVHVHLGQYQRAIQDANEAIKLDKVPAWAYLVRAQAAHHLGQLDAAITDLTEALSQGPDMAAAYLARASAYFSLARWDAVISDADAYRSRFGWQDQNTPFAVLLASLAHRRAGREREAATLLEDVATHGKPFHWPAPIVKYLRGEIPIPTLLALATDHGKMTEAQAYIGLDLLLAGRSEEALNHLRWVRDKGDRNFVEYRLAMGELRRLGAK